MGGQWIFILLCLTFAAELVFGSMFPEVPPNDPRGTVTTQEVSRPLNDLATPPSDVTVVAKTIVALDLRDNAAQRAREKNSETGGGGGDGGRQAAEVLRKIIVTNGGAEQKPNGRVITVRNNTGGGGGGGGEDVKKPSPPTKK